MGRAVILKSHREGSIKYFKIVKVFPFYPELKKIIYATIRLGDYLRNNLKDSEAIELAFVYGSVARDEETAKR